MIEEVRQHIEQLLAADVIRPSKSPYTSNVVLVRKKNGKLRLCVDYRQLNSITIKDCFSLPRMEEIFDSLHGAKYFTTIDMKSGYHQIEVEESHKSRTAFTVGSIGFFEYNKMPFGLTNSPATYQRIMQDILGDYNMTICLVYLDDLIIFSDSFEQHLERLDKILTRLHEANLKLAPEKCHFFKHKVNFLGHVVSAEGIETDPSKIEKVKNWPIPNNSDELRSFLAFAGYYRKFIKNFSQLIRPLAELLPPTSAKKNCKTTIKWKWTENEQKVFDKIKTVLSSPPILAYPDFTKPFELHTDASSKALGAVLYQTQNEKKRVIAYASRALSKSEKNYCAFKLEFLALKWAVTEKFSDYLTANHFTVFTDNNPLTHVLTSAKLDATGHRWASALGQYDFNIKYRAGLNNVDADIMSRYPYERIKEDENQESIVIEDKTVKAICNVIYFPYFETINMNSINLLETIDEPGQPLAQQELREIRASQRNDPLIEKWRRAVIDQKPPDGHLSKDDLTMKKQFRNFRMKRGILFRVISEHDKEIEQLVVPMALRNDILKGLHDDIGHPGQERTMRLMRERFYWPRVGSDVVDWVSKCDRCIRRKSRTDKAPLVNICSSYPLELVCIDFLSLEPSKGNFGNILIITDHYTKFAKAIPTKNQTAKTTADALYKEFIVNFGIPTKLHSDQGANFESELIHELCRLTNMKKSHTTPYHPQGNAGPERFNRTLLNMLGTLEEEQKHDWKKYINSLVYFYNCTPHESTRISPFELLFGRPPKLPIDIAFGKANESEETFESTQDYIQDLQETMMKTRDIVVQNIKASEQKRKHQYDKKAKAAKLSVGDHVLVKVLAFTGKHKIKDRYEADRYEIVEQPRVDIPVFKIRSLETGKEKTLHRNHLLLLTSNESLEAEDNVEIQEDPIEKDKNKDASIVDKSDVTEVENLSTDGYSNAGRAFLSGDAHIPDDLSQEEEDSEEEESSEVEEDFTLRLSEDSSETDTESSSEEESEVEARADGNESIPAEDPDNAKAIDPDTPIMSNSEDEATDESEDEATGEVTDESEDEATNEHAILDEPTGDEDENRDIEDTEKLDTESAVASFASEDTAHAKVDNLGEPDEEVHKVTPIPAPRRSNRERKIPQRFDEFVMYKMTNKSIDNKLQVLSVLFKSGVFNEMDNESAHTIVRAIMM